MTEHKRPSEIDQATPKDFDELKALLDAANEYALKRSGLKLWTIMDYVYGQLQSQVERGQCYVLRNHEGEITSCIALTKQGPAWGDAGKDGRALYFHKWMKHPGKSGGHEPQFLLRFAAEEALRQDKTFLRCDTVPSLVGLLRYYDRLGFRRAGLFVYKSSGRPGILLEIEAQKLLQKLS
jgi:hypothetical protein